MHPMMAYAGAGREADQQDVIEAQRAALSGAGANAVFTRKLGAAATQAFQAFGARRVCPLRQPAAAGSQQGQHAGRVSSRARPIGPPGRTSRRTPKSLSA